MASEETYLKQPVIRIPKLENATRSAWARESNLEAIWKAYGTSVREFDPSVISPDQPYHPSYYEPSSVYF